MPVPLAWWVLLVCVCVCDLVAALDFDGYPYVPSEANITLVVNPMTTLFQWYGGAPIPAPNGGRWPSPVCTLTFRSCPLLRQQMRFVRSPLFAAVRQTTYKRYNWNQIETAYNIYNWQALETDLVAAKTSAPNTRFALWYYFII